MQTTICAHIIWMIGTIKIERKLWCVPTVWKLLLLRSSHNTSTQQWYQVPRLSASDQQWWVISNINKRYQQWYASNTDRMPTQMILILINTNYFLVAWCGPMKHHRVYLWSGSTSHLIQGENIARNLDAPFASVVSRLPFMPSPCRRIEVGHTSRGCFWSGILWTLRWRPFHLRASGLSGQRRSITSDRFGCHLALWGPSCHQGDQSKTWAHHYCDRPSAANQCSCRKLGHQWWSRCPFPSCRRASSPPRWYTQGAQQLLNMTVVVRVDTDSVVALYHCGEKDA